MVVRYTASMKKIVLFLAYACALVVHPAMAMIASTDAPMALANSSACYNVQDSDARSFCLARTHREPSQCYNIKRPDLRAQCLAEVTR